LTEGVGTLIRHESGVGQMSGREERRGQTRKRWSTRVGRASASVARKIRDAVETIRNVTGKVPAYIYVPVVGTLVLVGLTLAIILPMQSKRLSVRVDIEARDLGSPGFIEVFDRDGTGEAELSFRAETFGVDGTTQDVSGFLYFRSRTYGIPQAVAPSAVVLHLPVDPRRCKWLATQLNARCENRVLKLPDGVGVASLSPLDITSESQRFETINITQAAPAFDSANPTPPPFGTMPANLSVTHAGAKTGASFCSSLDTRTGLTITHGFPFSAQSSVYRGIVAGPWPRERRCAGLTIQAGTGEPTAGAVIYVGDVDEFSLAARASSLHLDGLVGSVTIDGERQQYSAPGPNVDLGGPDDGTIANVQSRSRSDRSWPEVVAWTDSSKALTIAGKDARPTLWQKYEWVVALVVLPVFSFLIGAYVGHRLRT
jgi:hypothetical protein